MWRRLRSFGVSDSLMGEFRRIIGNIEAYGNEFHKYYNKEENVMKSTYNRKSSSIMIIVMLLILCAVTSLAVLFGRMVGYSQTEFENIMPLISAHSNASNTVAMEANSVQTATSNGQNTEKNPEFRMNADAEIFKISYENDKGEITVNGAEGNVNKLIAPGAKNKYRFTLENPGDVALDYTLSMEANITGTDEIFPIKVRVLDYTNKYLLGSAEQMTDVLDLNTVNEKSVLGAGRYAAYTLEWEWPFEQGDDEFDTMLGNLAVEDDIVLTIKINTTAEYDDNPDNNNVGLIIPQTGDDASLEYLWLTLAGSIVGICIVLFAGRKSKKKQNE